MTAWSTAGGEIVLCKLYATVTGGVNLSPANHIANQDIEDPSQKTIDHFKHTPGYLKKLGFMRFW